MTYATKADIERLEQKLDIIIEHFNIGKKPRRANAVIKQLAKEIAKNERKVSRKK
jgi:3-deoxy-D-arabino-heptulosonate 7-phosphate (DAHP) synthase